MVDLLYGIARGVPLAYPYCKHPVSFTIYPTYISFQSLIRKENFLSEGIVYSMKSDLFFNENQVNCSV